MREPSPPRRIGRRENSKRPFYSFAPTSAGRSLRLCERKKNPPLRTRKAAKAQRACPSRQIGRREPRNLSAVGRRENSKRPFYSFAPTSAGRPLRLCERKKNPSWRTRKAAKSLPSAGFTSKKNRITSSLDRLFDASRCQSKIHKGLGHQ